MIAIRRSLARSFRALARKCLRGRPRGPAPPVILECESGLLSMRVKTPDAILVHASPTTEEDRLLIVPFAVLEAIEGNSDDLVELSVDPRLQGVAHWSDRTGPRSLAFEAILPGTQDQRLAQPTRWATLNEEFLQALHECGRTTARDSTRLALTRIQLQGSRGQVIASDGRSALICSGYSFPFTQDVLVPAVPVFAVRELNSVQEVQVGKSATHLVVQSGPWQVYLPIDASGRYPDVTALIPRKSITEVGFEEAEALALLDRLPDLPGAKRESQPVTLELAGRVSILARESNDELAQTFPLECSRSSGSKARIVLDRRLLARALSLGCLRLQFQPERPLVFEGQGKILIALALEGSIAADSDEATNPELKRRSDVKPEPGGSAQTGRSEVPSSEDALACAEELRLALSDALGAANKLVQNLKQQKKEKKALAHVYAGLRALNLGSQS